MICHSSILLASLLAQAPSPDAEGISPAAPATPEKQLAPMVITGDRVLTPAESQGRSISVISGDELRRSGITRVSEAIRRVPGVNSAGNGPHGTQALFIRGAHQYHSKILVDGRPLASASETQVSSLSFLDEIPLDDVDHIEVVRGPQSVVHGSDAIGGVVNIITKRAKEDGNHGSVSVEGGSHGYLREALTLTGKSGAWDWHAMSSHAYEKGISSQKAPQYRDADAWENTSGRLGLGYSPVEQARFFVDGEMIRGRNEWDGSVYPPWPAPSVAAPWEADNRHRGLRLGGEFTGLADGLIDSSLVYSQGRSKRQFEVEHQPTENTEYHDLTQRIETVNTIHANDWLDLGLGADYEEQSAGGHGAWGPPSGRIHTFDQFVEARGHWDDRYFLTLGARHTDHDLFGDQWTGQVSGAIKIPESGTRLHASAGTGYRAPSIFELLGPNGSRDLAAEEAKSFDLGIDQKIGEHLSLGSTFFHTELTDMIDFVSANAPPWGYYRNVSFARMYGFENEAKWQATDTLGFRANYTWLHTENDKDEELARRPRHLGSLGADWQINDDWRLNSDLMASGTAFSGNHETNKLSGWATVNAGLGYKVRKDLEITGRVTNLFDQDYEVVKGYNTYGRCYYLGATWSF